MIQFTVCKYNDQLKPHQLIGPTSLWFSLMSKQLYLLKCQRSHHCSTSAPPPPSAFTPAVPHYSPWVMEGAFVFLEDHHSWRLDVRAGAPRASLLWGLFVEIKTSHKHWAGRKTVQRDRSVLPSNPRANCLSITSWITARISAALENTNVFASTYGV